MDGAWGFPGGGGYWWEDRIRSVVFRGGLLVCFGVWETIGLGGGWVRWWWFRQSLLGLFGILEVGGWSVLGAQIGAFSPGSGDSGGNDHFLLRWPVCSGVDGKGGSAWWEAV